jgi:hypothetical protein
MDIEVVRRRLLLSIAGALAAGCGPVVVLPDGGDDESSTSGTPADSGGATTAVGATTATSHDSSHSDSGTTGPEPEPQTTSDDASGGDELLDFGGKPPIPAECVPQPPPPVEQCGAPLPTQYDDTYFVFHCVGLPEDVSCEAWAEGFNEPQHGWTIIDCGTFECSGPYALEIGCGPLPDFGDQCCFWFAVVDTQICPGRPFVVAGRERLAPVRERDDWRDDTALTVDARPLDRAAIASAWAEQAAFEHASIASFARFILQLLACDAPARLVTRAQRALGEEIEHAQLFFGFASHYAGRPLGPSALDIRDALEASADFDAIVLAAVREGCIAETISAWHVALAATSARDPAMARALARVAEQELEHAALAWAFLAWARPRASDTLRARIEETFHAAERHVPRGPTLDSSVRSAAWLAHGILPAEEHAAATRHALRELVDPVARSLVNVVAPAPRAAAASERPSAS